MVKAVAAETDSMVYVVPRIPWSKVYKSVESSALRAVVVYKGFSSGSIFARMMT